MTYEEFKEKVGSVILTGEGNCPVTPVVQMLQGKWKLQILYELCIKCPMRFGELKKVLRPITNTALTNALKELETQRDNPAVQNYIGVCFMMKGDYDQAETFLRKAEKNGDQYAPINLEHIRQAKRIEF